MLFTFKILKLCMKIAVLFAVLSLILFTAGDAWLKVPSEKQGALITTLFITLFSSLILFAVSVFWKGSFGIYALGYSALSGLLMGTGLLLVLISLKKEQMSDTMSLIPVSYLVPVLWGTFVLHERINVYETIGTILIFAGTFFIMFKTLKLNFGLIPALMGNIFWGLQLIVFNYAVSNTSNYPLVGAFGNFISFLLMTVFLILKRSFNFKRKYVGHSLIIAALQSFALLSALIIEALNSMAIGFSVIAAEPALLTIIGYFVFEDRINAIQLLGVISMFVGLFILS